MRVFVVGAIGTRLVHRLIERGHDVIGTSSSERHTARIRALGAEPVTLDLLDTRAVLEAVRTSAPDAIAHEATSLSELRDFKHFDQSFAQTNRLRTEGIDALLAAAREASVRRVVAQSYANGRYARVGGPVKTEQDPLDPSPVPAMRATEAAMLHLDEAVTSAGGIALRYGNFYGASNDAIVEPVRKRRFPIVGDAAASLRSSTSTTRPLRPCSRSSTASPASTTSSTTSPRPCASGSRCSRRSSERSHLITSHAGSRAFLQDKRHSWAKRPLRNAASRS